MIILLSMCAYKVNAYFSIREIQTEATTCNTQIIFVDVLPGGEMVPAYI